MYDPTTGRKMEIPLDSRQHIPYAGPGVTGVGRGPLGSEASMRLEVPSCMSNSPNVH